MVNAPAIGEETFGLADTLQWLAVLYADISGSSRLYEQFGDVTAQRDIVRCLTLLTEVAQAHGGRLERTIGDEVMCSFVLPERAAQAAVAMHEKLREASAAQAFVSGTLRVRIGWHYGVAESHDGELGGALPLVAQQVTALARPDEILASDPAVAALSAACAVVDTVWPTLLPDADADDNHRRMAPWRARWDELRTHNEQAARIFNVSVTQDNAGMAQFPAMLLAWIFGFTPARVLSIAREGNS